MESFPKTFKKLDNFYQSTQRATTYSVELIHHLLKRPDTNDLKIFVRTFEKLSERLRNCQDVCCQDVWEGSVTDHELHDFIKCFGIFCLILSILSLAFWNASRTVCSLSIIFTPDFGFKILAECRRIILSLKQNFFKTYFW